MSDRIWFGLPAEAAATDHMFDGLSLLRPIKGRASRQIRFSIQQQSRTGRLQEQKTLYFERDSRLLDRQKILLPRPKRGCSIVHARVLYRFLKECRGGFSDIFA